MAYPRVGHEHQVIIFFTSLKYIFLQNTLTEFIYIDEV